MSGAEAHINAAPESPPPSARASFRYAFGKVPEWNPGFMKRSIVSPWLPMTEGFKV